MFYIGVSPSHHHTVICCIDNNGLYSFTEIRSDSRNVIKNMLKIDDEWKLFLDNLGLQAPWEPEPILKDRAKFIVRRDMEIRSIQKRMDPTVRSLIAMELWRRYGNQGARITYRSALELKQYYKKYGISCRKKYFVANFLMRRNKELEGITSRHAEAYYLATMGITHKWDGLV